MALRIVFLCSGERIRFEDLTGIPHPKCGIRELLTKHAASAQKIDPQITGYEIVDEEHDAPPRNVKKPTHVAVCIDLRCPACHKRFGRTRLTAGTPTIPCPECGHIIDLKPTWKSLGL